MNVQVTVKGDPTMTREEGREIVLRVWDDEENGMRVAVSEVVKGPDGVSRIVPEEMSLFEAVENVLWCDSLAKEGA